MKQTNVENITNIKFDFETETHGKWILAGEHAVMRGSPAVVFPLSSHKLKLSYCESSEDIQTQFSGVYGENIHVLLWGVIERGLEITKHNPSEVSGFFHLHNDIPLGAGLGASAALCVAIARWFHFKSWITKEELQNFARQLENLFHIASSGVDIIAVSSKYPVFFTQELPPRFIEPCWQPCWYLSYTDQVAITSACVKKVKDLELQNPPLAKRIDQDMQDCAYTAYRALTVAEKSGLPLLTFAINRAHICFTQWGLTGGKVERHISQLLEAGALAAKPTGAGDGGFVLSLWAEPPEVKLPFELLTIRN